MRFNGVDIRDVHRAVSVEKEIPPGMPEMTIETAQGWDGETFVGRTMGRGSYVVRVNIACRQREEAWRVRALLAQWAMSSGNATAALEPTHWPGVAYDAVAGSISEPEFARGFGKVVITFILPRPVAHDVAESRASGSGSVSMLVRGSMPCRPVIRQVLASGRSGLALTLDGKAFFTVRGQLNAGQTVEIDTGRAALTVDGVHAEERVSVTGTVWRPGFTPGVHTLGSSDGGTLEARWHSEWA